MQYRAFLKYLTPKRCKRDLCKIWKGVLDSPLLKLYTYKLYNFILQFCNYNRRELLG